MPFDEPDPEQVQTGIGVGFTYFVADGLAVAMGEAGKLPPVIAAWSPGLIFAALGGFVVLQVER